MMHYEWEPLTDGVCRCRLPFLDVTVGLVKGQRDLLLIDCGTTLVEASAIAADALALTGGAVTHVVMTHDHFDHILGSAGFGDAELFGAVYVPGHGAVVNSEFVRRQRDWLAARAE